ncbi:MAG TPA: hypothetical protein VN688_32305 [Gemmataceae bacterium]|nr:hypothetical protein [Gemmataceae bacterium]
MRILNWLFGKKEQTGATAIKECEPVTSKIEKLTETGHPPERSAPTTSSEERQAENLRRWRESGQIWTWVQTREGRWDHDAWLGLLEELQRSSFWPMCPDAVGLALEETKREWLSRN